MPAILAAQRASGCAATTAMPRQVMPQLSLRALAWLAEHPLALVVVESVWDTLTELEAGGAHPRLLAAVQFVLVHHEPTAAGRCRACRRLSWRGVWRRRPFPCVVWRQIQGELLGHLSLWGRARTGSARSAAR